MFSSGSQFPARFLFSILVVSALSIVLALAGCTGATTSVTTAQATTATQAMGATVLLVIAHQGGWNTSGTAVSYSTTGLSMSGTASPAGSPTTYVLAITLSGYVDAATGYTLNGTVNWSQSGTSSSQSGTVTGSLTLSGGPVTSASWNTSFTSSGGPPTFSDTITCNGTNFDANTLLTPVVQAQTAMQAVISGLAAGLNQANWTLSGTTVSTGPSAPAGLSVSGTYTQSGSTATCVLTITLTNYVAGTTGYTETGTINWSTVENTSTPATYTSGTVIVSMSLSGGPVTTEIWNVTSLSGIASAPTFGGLITINGTSWDAKIL